MQAVVEQYPGVLDALSDGVIVVGDDRRVLLFNRSAVSIFPDLAVGATLADCWHAFYDEIEANFDSALSGRVSEAEKVFARPSGQTFCLEMRFSSAADGLPGGPVVITAKDVTRASLYKDEKASNFSELEIQLRTARRYQEALFTSRYEDHGISCRAFGKPAFELSGDFFEVGTAGERFLFVLGDVQSHGVEVAIKAITLQHLTRLNLGTTPVAAHLMNLLNRFVFSDQQGSFWSSCMFIGCFDPLTRQIYYSRAGVPEPIMFHADGSYELLEIGDTPLGFFEEEQYRNGLVQADPGDRLILYSDGVTDSHSLDDAERYYGQDRLIRHYQELIRGAAPEEHFCSQLVKRVEEFHGGNVFADDFTLAEVIFK